MKNSQRIIDDIRLRKDIPKSNDSLTRLRFLKKRRRKRRGRKGKKSKKDKKPKKKVSDLKFEEDAPKNCEKILSHELTKKFDLAVFESY